MRGEVAVTIGKNPLLVVVKGIANAGGSTGEGFSQGPHAGIQLYLQKDRITLIAEGVAPRIEVAFCSFHDKKKMGTQGRGQGIRQETAPGDGEKFVLVIQAGVLLAPEREGYEIVFAKA